MGGRQNNLVSAGASLETPGASRGGLLGALGWKRRKQKHQNLQLGSTLVTLKLQQSLRNRLSGPDIGWELMRWLGNMGLILCVAYPVVMGMYIASFHPNDRPPTSTPAIVIALFEITAASQSFRFLRRKRLNAISMTVGTGGIELLIEEKPDKTESKKVPWDEIKGVVSVVDDKDNPVQLNVFPSKAEVVTIYNQADIQQVLQFVRSHVRTFVCGKTSYYYYAFLPVAAFAIAAPVCVLAERYNRQIVLFIFETLKYLGIL